MKTKLFFLILLAFFGLSISAQGTWTQKVNLGGMERWGAVGFSIGNKGYIGTGGDGTFTIGNGYSDFWEYDPATNTWTQKANFGGTARALAVGFSIGTKGYIGTGGLWQNDFWEYDQATNMWSQKSNFTGAGRIDAVGFSINGKGYIGTGTLSNGDHTNDFWEYDPATDTWTQKTNLGGFPRYRAVGFSIGTKGYIGTGSLDSVVGNNHNIIDGKDFWEYDPTANSWTRKSDFVGGDNGAVGFSIGTKGYIGVGINVSPSGKYFYEWDQATNVWIQKANFGGTPRYFSRTVGFSINGKGYIGTGTDTSVSLLKDFWEYDPNITGINENNIENSISVYPNPSNGKFTLDSKITNGEISIYNIAGEKVYESQILNTNIEIDLTEKSNGIYFINVKTEKESFTKKIIINH